MQLSLFTFQFDSRIRRVDVDGVTYFSIFDTFEYTGSVGSAKNPRVYWANAKKRLEKQSGDVVTGVLQHRFDGQGQRETPVAPFRFFLRLAQVVEIVEWEHVRQWMADAAHERLEEEANPEKAIQRGVDSFKRQGKSDAWIADRLGGIGERNAFTRSMKQHIIDLIPHIHYGQATNMVSEGLWHRDTNELRQEMGLKKSQNLRDFQTRQALHYIGIAEATIAHFLDEKQSVDWQEATKIIIAVSASIGVQADQLGKMMGMDIATGKPLLKGALQ